jgi:predicted nicotinamide N-methyase
MKQYDTKKVRRTIAKYATNEVRFDLHDGLGLSMAVVVDPYVLLDKMAEREAQQKRAERFPYWAEIWPTSLALARWLWQAQLQKPEGWVCELGCGLGLVGIVLARLGWRVEATDFVEDALVFASYNAMLNKIGANHRVSYLDWRNPVGKQRSCMVASDVVYEKKNHPYLDRILRRLLMPGGHFYLGDPQRKASSEFVKMLEGQGYGHQVKTQSQSWAGKEHQVDIHEFTKPSWP